ncbi:MAG: phage tail tape measure protein [Aeriscardovia sp.]|nr:phage tail tape measure protein [Aeriscardovia sp.]
MAGRIAGITIEIGGDSTKLQNSLKGVDKSLKQTQTALKDIDKLLKFNPGNTELLVQKQRNLKKAIGETKDRLKELRKAAENTTPEQIGQEKYDALQREIIDTENKLKSLTKEMRGFGSVAGQKLQAVGASMKELGGTIQNVGKELSTKLTAPILALGGASIAAFKSVDSGYDIMIAKTGATGDAAKKLRGIMNNLASEIPTDFETAGAAVGEVNTRFGITGDELEDLSGKFIKFAKLNNTDVSTSIDGVQKALSAYGLGAESAGSYLDRLNKVGQDTGVSVDKLTSGLVTNGTAFQELGLSIDQSTVFMGQLEKSGANSETVLNGMRKALKNATAEGKPLDQALSDLQNTIENGTGSMDGLTAAYDLFGKSGDQIYGAVKNGTLDFEALGSTVDDVGGNINATFEETKDPIDEFKTAMNELKIIGAEIGSTVLEVLKPALDQLKTVLETLKEKWDELSPSQQEMIVKIALIVAAIGPLLTVLGGVITAAGTIISVLGMLLSPIGLVIAAIAGLIAAGLWLHAHWDQVCEWANNLKERVTQAFEGLKANVTAKIQAAKNKVSSVVNAMKADVTGKVNALKSAVSNAFSAVHNAISSKMSAAKNAVSNAISAIKGLLSGSISFPHITLPHFTVTGSPPFGLGGHGSPPHISVEWYAKAMKQPYVLDGATIFGMMGGKMLGGGEAGREIVIGEDAFNRMTNMTRVDARLASIERILVEYLPAGQKIVMDSGELVGVVNRGLGGLYG